MPTPALALCTNLTAPTIGEVIFITIATVAIVNMGVVPVEHVSGMVPGLGKHPFVSKVRTKWNTMSCSKIFVQMFTLMQQSD